MLVSLYFPSANLFCGEDTSARQALRARDVAAAMRGVTELRAVLGENVPNGLLLEVLCAAADGADDSEAVLAEALAWCSRCDEACACAEDSRSPSSAVEDAEDRGVVAGSGALGQRVSIPLDWYEQLLERFLSLRALRPLAARLLINASSRVFLFFFSPKVNENTRAKALSLSLSLSLVRARSREKRKREREREREIRERDSREIRDSRFERRGAPGGSARVSRRHVFFSSLFFFFFSLLSLLLLRLGRAGGRI